MASLKQLLVLGIGALFTATEAQRVGVETRTLDQIHQAALKEGGVVTLWSGGDEQHHGNGVKSAFEARFPGMTLNITVDVSKYHDGNIDLQLASNSVYVDCAMLQTLHDFPRWKAEGALLNYKPAGFDKIYPDFKDAEGAFYGAAIYFWSNTWNAEALKTPPKEYTDYLKPEFKNKLVITYPNDDDAVLWQFDLNIRKYGWKWFDALLAQNPRWVRGTATAATLVASSNGTYLATFSSYVGLSGFGPVGVSFPEKSDFVAWPQTTAIFKKAPHPEGAMLLQNFLLSLEYQGSGGWSPRSDAPKPANYPTIKNVRNTRPQDFLPWMKDRARVERLRFIIEKRIGTPQGLSPLDDDL